MTGLIQKFIAPFFGILLCSLAQAAQIDSYLDQANAYSKTLEEGIVGVKEQNTILDQKYAASLAQVEKFRKSLDPSIREKANLEPIKAGLLAKKNQIDGWMKVDDASVAGYRKVVSALVTDLQAIKAEYQKFEGQGDYQNFLVEKAKKRLQAFRSESYPFEKILGFYSNNWKSERLKIYSEYEQSGAAYNRALAANIHLEKSCEGVGSISGILPEAYVKSETNFQDPVLWNFVLMGGKDTLAVECQRNRIRGPSISFDQGKHKLNYAWQYTIDPIGMNESRYPRDNTWDLLYSEAKKHNLKSSPAVAASSDGEGEASAFSESAKDVDSTEAR